jgi:dihydrolipoamide dehydrogenase
METFDLLVIGGGPGGYLAAERAAAGGLTVALFEKESLGGTCLNHGCIPTKTLLNSAKLYRHATESEAFGVTSENVKYDHAKVIRRKEKVVKTLVGGVAAALARHNVHVISSAAKISSRTKEGFVVATEAGETYTGRRLCIATGSETVIPPIEGLRRGLETGFVVTNRELLQMTDLPQKLVVIGGGVIGLEMACYFASIGVKVTVIEMMDKIAGSIDRDICNLLMSEYAERGMEFMLSSKVLEIASNAVIYEEKGEKKQAECDLVLLSAGRRPSASGIGLETIGVELDRGAVITDSHMQTNVAGVYAVGDCTGRLMLAHAAYREAEVAANHMLGIRDEMRYESIASVIYTDPEVASVGETKESAEKRGLKSKEIIIPMAYSGRYVAETEGGNGFAKLIVDRQKNRLLGVHLVGPYASEIILAAAMMLDMELPPQRLQKLVFPHPSVGEVIKEALFRI